MGMWGTQFQLRWIPGGGFPVPGAMEAAQLPPSVKRSIMRLLDGPPKPAVSLAVMEQTQLTMLEPDLPWRADV